MRPCRHGDLVARQERLLVEAEPSQHRERGHFHLVVLDTAVVLCDVEKQQRVRTLQDEVDNDTR